MQEVNFLSDEQNHNLYKVEYNKKKVWSFLRMDCRFHIIKKKQNWGRSKNSSRLKDKFKLVQLIFWGFTNWFKSYDYIILNDSVNRRHLDEQLFSKDFDYLHKILGEKILFIETTKGYFQKRKDYYSANIVSGFFINFLSKIAKNFIKLNKPWKNKEYFKILTKINFDYNSLIKYHYAKKSIYKLLFKFYRPQIIFINCYYSFIPAIEAAKELNIKTIEIQHGRIGTRHLGYNLQPEFEKKMLPDEIFVYGKIDKQTMITRMPYSERQVKIVGSYIMDYYLEKFPIKKQYCSESKPNKIRILITSQNSLEEKMLNFTIELANHLAQTEIHYLPRNNFYKNGIKNKPKNLTILQESNFYEIISTYNIHSTVHSTTAPESQMFGVPNIYIDIDGLARFYMEEYMPESEHTKYVATPKEYGKALEAINLPPENDISLFAVNCEKNVREEILK